MQTTHHHATLKDLEALPEGSRAELINDRLVMLPRPTGAHIKATNELFYELNGPSSRKKDGPGAGYLSSNRSCIWLGRMVASIR